MIVPLEIHELDNPHMKTAEAILTGNAKDFDRADLDYLFICFTNRSGSNFLAEAVASDGTVNEAGEFFNSDTIQDVCQSDGLKTFSQFVGFLADRYQKSGLLISKLSVTQLHLLARYGFFEKNALKSSFLSIRREDIVAQAISVQIAAQNLQWTSQDIALLDDAKLNFSVPDITMTVDAIIYENYLWDKFFAYNMPRMMRISYESFCMDTKHQVDLIAGWLGRNFKLDAGRCHLKPQSRSINHDWKKNYLAELQSQASSVY